MTTLRITAGFASFLEDCARRHASDPYSEKAHMSAGVAVDLFCRDNSGLSFCGGGSGATEFAKAPRCAEFTLADLKRGKTSGRKDFSLFEDVGQGLDHLAFFKQGRRPVLVASSPYVPSDMLRAERWRRGDIDFVRTGLPSWYAPGLCALDLIVPDHLTLVREDLAE